MVRLREIPRTATFAWSPGTGSPYIATGTRAGAVDAEFSNETQLELWDLNLSNNKHSHELQPAASIDTDSRFHDIAWVRGNDDFPNGVIAGALENGSLDLWNAKKLIDGQEDSFMSRTSKHSAAIKALQFNPFRSELLATAGDKGELFISDLNNIQSPFRMGTSLARADDFECLDWNKNVPHILATGSSGGFVTVWDVKTKKESLTLNNLGRKAVSAVAWDPDKHTRLITAIPHDTEPVILVWDLRNSNTPEKTLRGHDGGVLSLSWCPQDNDLLLSCGKDNRTICWNPQTAESYGEFPVVTNWTFQTRWNPHNPNLLATASFDGKIGVHTIQNSNRDAHPASGSQSQTVNDEDFFSKAQSQPQGASFSLTKAPKWFERPCGASFGFGGKVLTFTKSDSPSDPPTLKRSSKIRISTFAIDAGVGTSTDAFENALKQKDLESICESKIAAATRDTEKADWKVIETLTSKSPKQSLIRYLGFSGANDEEADDLSELTTDSKSKEADASQLDVSSTKSNRLSAFFDSNADSESFLSELAATKGAKINNPFQIYSGSESDSDRKITRALLLGQYDKALNVCLQEERLSDAFMVAICGGQACIDRVQKAYFNRKAGGPNYLRLLASVAGKNLWDVVYNAELTCWKDIMAIICTYASEEEFSDLCEALGDRLDEQWRTRNEDPDLRKNAAFCYLAGSKLEKVVTIWISELDEHEETDLDASSSESSFSIHARSLQSFIEKVTVFREVTGFQDTDREASSGWKLRALYEKYTEYADIIASHGQLQIAEKYLDLLPQKYPGADIAKNRIKEAIHRPSHSKPNASQPNAPTIHSQNTKSLGNNQEKPAASRRAPPAGSAVSSFAYPGPGQPNPVTSGPPASTFNAPPSVAAPSKSPAAGNWNDTPESFFKPPTSRRGTPSALSQPAIPYAVAGQVSSAYGVPPKSVPPLGPPPKGPVGPPPRMNSPATNIGHSYQQPDVGHAGTGHLNPTYGAQLGINQPNPAYGLQQGTGQPNPAYGLQQGAGQQSSAYGLQPVAGQPSPAYGLQPGAGQSNPAYGLQPGAGQSNPAYGLQPGAGQSNPAYGSQPGTPLNRPYVTQPKSSLPLAPPPKGPIGPPPRIDSPSANLPNMHQPPERPPSSARNAYAPQQPPQTSRYTPSPSVQPVNSRYAPSPSVHQAVPPQPNITSAQHEAPSGPPQTLPSGSRPGTAASQRPKPAMPVPSKYPPGDRSHIPAGARTIFEILSSDMQRVKAVAPQSFKQQVTDTEKRLNILFDHLNNEDLLKEQTVKDMVELAQSLQARNYEQAQMIHVDIMTNRTEECGNWMVGVKRLIGMSRATP